MEDIRYVESGLVLPMKNLFATNKLLKRHATEHPGGNA